MSSLFLRQICADNQTLNQYLKGGFPSIGEIKRNLFLRERGFDYTQPDHYYKNHMERLLVDVADTAGLILQGFDAITGLYLDFRGNKVNDLRQSRRLVL